MMQLSDSIPSQRHKLIEVFVERNSKINLSAIRSPEEIYQKHILDALELTKLDRQNSLPPVIPAKAGIQACDLGTGGGFPLLPLALTYPDIYRTGLDARRKKIDAINDICSQLDLKNCHAIHARTSSNDVEYMEKQGALTSVKGVTSGKADVGGLNKKYDIVTARAVAHAETLLPWVDQILKPGGLAIFYKLFTASEDKIIKKYGRKIESQHRYSLDDDGVQKVLYVLKKPE